MEYLKSIPNEYYLYGSIIILLIGVILGFTKTITVYRDYADLTKVFMLVLAPIGIFSILGDKVESKIINNILLVIESLIILWILVTTYLDNRNIFKTILAFITKIPLGVIFAFYLVNLISPHGNSMGKRSKSRGLAGLILIFIGPILYGLVRNRVWHLKTE
jgi:hypothetical protein